MEAFVFMMKVGYRKRLDTWPLLEATERNEFKETNNFTSATNTINEIISTIAENITSTDEFLKDADIYDQEEALNYDFGISYCYFDSTSYYTLILLVFPFVISLYQGSLFSSNDTTLTRIISLIRWDYFKASMMILIGSLALGWLAWFVIYDGLYSVKAILPMAARFPPMEAIKEANEQNASGMKNNNQETSIDKIFSPYVDSNVPMSIMEVFNLTPLVNFFWVTSTKGDNRDGNLYVGKSDPEGRLNEDEPTHTSIYPRNESSELSIFSTQPSQISVDFSESQLTAFNNYFAQFYSLGRVELEIDKVFDTETSISEKKFIVNALRFVLSIEYDGDNENARDVANNFKEMIDCKYDLLLTKITKEATQWNQLLLQFIIDYFSYSLNDQISAARCVNTFDFLLLVADDGNFVCHTLSCIVCSLDAETLERTFALKAMEVFNTDTNLYQQQVVLVGLRDYVYVNQGKIIKELTLSSVNMKNTAGMTLIKIYYNLLSKGLFDDSDERLQDAFIEVYDIINVCMLENPSIPSSIQRIIWDKYMRKSHAMLSKDRGGRTTKVMR